MSTETVVRARIDERVKEKAAKVLSEMGLSVSDAIRLLLTRIAAEQALPFEISQPNAETQQAMGELERRRDAPFKTVAALMADLNADDWRSRASSGITATQNQCLATRSSMVA